MITKLEVNMKGRVCFFGPKEEIEPLFTSAFNWGIIRPDIEISEGDYERFWFSANKSSIIRWRMNVESLRFDVERLESKPFKDYLRKKAIRWYNLIPKENHRLNVNSINS